MTVRKYFLIKNEVYVIHEDGVRVNHGTHSAVTMTLSAAKDQLKNYIGMGAGIIFRKEGGYYSGNKKLQEQLLAIRKRIAHKYQIVVYKPTKIKIEQ